MLPYEALRAKLQSSPPDDACEEMRLDKVDCLLSDKTAGFSRAKAWMTSPDPSLRRKAGYSKMSEMLILKLP
jgi:hypothetical protein